MEWVRGLGAGLKLGGDGVVIQGDGGERGQMGIWEGSRIRS